jgi:hypothetical protein
VPYIVPPAGYSAGLVREVAEGILAALGEDADALEMFAASPRVPPPGTGWVPLPYLVPRIAGARAFLGDIRRAGGGGFKLLRAVLLTLANVGVLELYVSPMSSSPVGRIRFVRLIPRETRADLEALIPDRGHLYDPWGWRH